MHRGGGRVGRGCRFLVMPACGRSAAPLDPECVRVAGDGQWNRGLYTYQRDRLDQRRHDRFPASCSTASRSSILIVSISVRTWSRPQWDRRAAIGDFSREELW